MIILHYCTVFQKCLLILFRCSFYKYRLFFIIFDTQSTNVSCNTAVIHLPTLPAYCCYTTLGKFELHNNDFINKCWIFWLHILKNIQFFYTIIVQQSLSITITFSFIHAGLIGGHKPGPIGLNLRFSRRCSNSIVWCTHKLLAHCLGGRCQRYSHGTSGRNICYASIQFNIIVVCNGKNFHWSDFIVMFWSHYNGFVDGTNQPKWSKNKKLILRKVV